MIGFCPLASGSKGNCIYLGSHKTKILIDAGLSAKAITSKLAQINVNIEEIDAILITHEHTDHIQGLKVLAFKNKIPVLANTETAKGIVDAFNDCPKFKIFSTGETFEFGDLSIHPFSIPHDTLDPVGFTISIDALKLGFCTDLGFATSLVSNRLSNCHYLVLEANHDPQRVHACNRPMIYKKRVLGPTGHLSNESCGNLLLQVAGPSLKHVHLAHLSSECNTPDTALSVVRGILKGHGINLDMCVAPQEMISKAIYF